MKPLLFITSLTFSLQGLSQLPDYHVQLFDESFGVRTNEVKKVVKDKQDFVWIMHNDRVQRFDGKHIKDFLIQGELTFMLCDRNNRIWVVGGPNLYCFANDNRGFLKAAVDTIKKLAIISVCQLPGKELWVLTTRGYYILDSVKLVFRKHPDPFLGNVKLVENRGADENKQTVFFCIPDSVVAYNTQTGTRRTLPQPQFNIRNVNALTDELAIVSIWKGILYLYDFSKRSITQIDLSQHLKNVQDYFVTAFSASQVGNEKWLLATTKGLIEYNNTTGRFQLLRLFHKGKPVEGNSVFWDLHIDNMGIGWIAYNNYGVISFNTSSDEPGLVRNYETDITKAWDNNVRNFAEDENGNLWLATFNGFVRWNMEEGIIQPYFAKEGSKDQVNHPSIRGIAYDGIHLILGQTNRGIWLYNPKTRKYRRPLYAVGKTGDEIRNKIEGSFIDQIYTLKNGDHIVLGSNGAYLLNGRTYILTVLKFPGEKENLNFGFQDSRKNIWLGTGKALYCLDSSMSYRFKVGIKRTNGVVHTMTEWNDGSLILGSIGLYKMTAKDTSAMINSIHPLFSNVHIHILYKDKLDKLWLGTSEGLLRYDMLTKKIESFSNFENIEGNSFYPNSFCRAKNGLLCLGSNRGIIYFNPEKIGEQADSITMIMKAFKVNGDDSSFVGVSPLRLKYFQNTIAFDFITPYYRNAGKLKYRYRLQGLDTGWTTNGNNNSVIFHSLQPGRYEFQAAVSINGNDWFESAERVTFSIRPPFWRTGWFYSGVVFLIGLGIYLVYRYQLNKKLEVERLRMGIARDLHDDIGSALSNIHIISAMAVKNQQGNGSAGQAFGKIKESSKEIMENMQDIVWAINPENDNLEQVLAKMKEFAGELCESAEIEYEFDTDKNLENIKLTVNKRKDLFLVFKEALNNAVKYSSATQIRFSLFKKPGGWLSLTIHDNGKGFIRNEIHSGNGLRNMEERAREVNGQIHIESGNGSGTLVELKIPIT